MDDLLQKGIAALRAGDRIKARRVLTRFIESNPRSDLAWLWLSGAVDSDSERLICLERALSINPHNAAARRGMAALHKKQQQQVVKSDTFLPPAPGRADQFAPQRTSDDLDHSTCLKDLPPEHRQALEGFASLVAHELRSKRSRREIIERLVKRGFPRKAVIQFVRQVAPQPERAPTKYERRLETEMKDALPWLTIWTKPKDTIRWIVNDDPTQYVLLNVAMAGIVGVVNSWLTAYTIGAGQPFLSSSTAIIQLGVSAIAAPIVAIPGLYILGAAIRLSSGWLGGRASATDVRAAISWGASPLLWLAILWIPGIALYVYATQYGSPIDWRTGTINNPGVLTAIGILWLIEAIVSIWSTVVTMKCLGAVNRFSAWRALVAHITGQLIIAVPVGCLFALIGQLIMALLT